MVIPTTILSKAIGIFRQSKYTICTNDTGHVVHEYAYGHG